MREGWGVVAGVLAAEGIADDRFAQIPFCVAATTPFVDRFFQRSVDKSDFLAKFNKNDDRAGILADGTFFFSSDPRVVDQLAEYFPAVWRFFVLEGFIQRHFNIGREVGVGFNTEAANRFGDLLCGKFSHANNYTTKSCRAV